MLVVGAAGLLMTRSLGSTAALVVALGLYGLTNAGRRRTDAKPGLVTPYRLLLVVVVGLAVADDPATDEPSRLAGVPHQQHGAAAADGGRRTPAVRPSPDHGHRLAALARRGALPGAQRRASAPVGRRDRRSGSSLARSSTAPPSTISYVQILAEAGAVGFLAFLAVVVAVGIGVFRLLRDARADPSLFVSTRAAVILLVATMVWLNDNPLFGSQPETVMAALFLGILAAVPPILVTSVTPSP